MTLADLNLVTADIGGIIPFLVVLVVIVYQIRKAMNKGQVPPPDQTPDASLGSPEEELQEFLRRLQQGPDQPPPRPPAPSPPPPPPAPPAVRQLPAEAWRQKREASLKRREARRVPAQPPPLPASQPLPPVNLTIRESPEDLRVSASEIGHTRPASTTESALATRKLRMALRSDLIDRNALRKAVVLADILGRPIALRGPIAPGAR